MNGVGREEGPGSVVTVDEEPVVEALRAPLALVREVEE